MATDKQIKFITTLKAERLHGEVYVQTQLDSHGVTSLEALSNKDASNIIGVLMAEPKITKASGFKKPYENSLEVGVYKTLEGTLLRVYKGKQSGMNLVKKVVPTVNGYEYEYVGSAFRVAKGESSLGLVKILPLTKEEAAAWGRMTGSCIICGRHLDDPESVDAGIGPVCAKGF